MSAESQTNFERAKAAIEANEIQTLKQLLAIEPSLARQQEDSSKTLLHDAASSGCVEMTRLLLEAGAAVDGAGPDDGTPLHWAASLDHRSVCELLVEFGADLERSDGLGEGGTPLVQAIFYAHRDTADYLGGLLVTPNNLRVAAGLGRLDLLHSFFDATGGLKPEAGQCRSWYRSHDEFPTRPTTDDPEEILSEALCYAAFNNRAEAVRFLLDHGANPNDKPHFATALHFATATGNAQLVQTLLDGGADPTVVDDNYDSVAAGWAEWGGDDAIATLLRKAAARSSLRAASAANDLDALKSQLDQIEPLDPNSLSEALETALAFKHHEAARALRERGATLSICAAARLGQYDEVKRELADGVSPDSCIVVEVPHPGSGAVGHPMPAILAAAINQHGDVTQLLRDAGAKVDAFTAAAINDTQLCQAFLNEGHDVNACDAFGRTMLHRALQGHALDAATLLLENGADVNDQAGDYFSFGGRALHVAAESGAPKELIQRLVGFGAKINQSMNPGTPLDCARRYDNHDTAAELLKHGALTGAELRAQLDS